MRLRAHSFAGRLRARPGQARANKGTSSRPGQTRPGTSSCGPGQARPGRPAKQACQTSQALKPGREGQAGLLLEETSAQCAQSFDSTNITGNTRVGMQRCSSAQFGTSAQTYNAARKVLATLPILNFASCVTP